MPTEGEAAALELLDFILELLGEEACREWAGKQNQEGIVR